MEEFKNIKGFEDLYKINKEGLIYSIKSDIFMKEGITKFGYHKICLRKNKKHYYYTTHRLVALTFLDNPFNYPQVHHIDEDKSNNNLTNLEWVTVSKNNTLVSSKKLSNSGERNINKFLRKGKIYYEVEIRRNKLRYCKNTKTIELAIKQRDLMISQFGY